MALGQELKDFAAGFQMGANTKDKRADRAERAEDRAHRRERDKIDDAWRTRQADEQTRQFNVGEERANRQFDRSDAYRWAAHEEDKRQWDLNRGDKLAQDQWTKDRYILESEREFQEKYGPALEERDRFGQWYEGQPAPGGQALPTPGDEPASGPQSMSTEGYRLSSFDGRKEPRSGQEIAYNLVLDLQNDLGISRAAAIGSVGQLAGETGGFTQMQELNPVVPGSRGGGGYAQWTGPRRRQFEAWARDQGLDTRSYAANYGFLRHELMNTPEGRILQQIGQSDDYIAAGRAFTGSEASRSGFLRPRIVNTAGRDNWTRKVASLFEDQGTRAGVRAARGGLIEEPERQVPMGIPMPDYEGEGVAPVRVAQALPTQETMTDETDDMPVPTPTSAPRDDEGRPDSQLAVREGMKWAQSNAGIGEQLGIQDPRLQKMAQRYLTGYGAAPRGIVEEAKRAVDPEGTMSPAERNVKALGSVYRFYVDQGNPEKAQAAAGQMLQTLRMQATQFGAFARAAAEEGDLDAAARAAVAAYANVPDGNDLQIEKTDNGYQVTVTDIESGDVIQKEVMSPEQMAQAAMGFSPQGFDEQLFRAAGGTREYKTQAPEKVDEGRTRITEQMDAILEANPEFGAAMESPDARQLVEQFAAGISGIEQNQMSSQDAVYEAMNILTQDTSGSDNFSMEPIGDGMVRVTGRNGKFVVPAQIAQRMVQFRERGIAEREAKRAEEEANAAERQRRWNRVKETGAGVVEALTSGGNQRENAAAGGRRIGNMVPTAPAERGGRLSAEPDPERFGGPEAPPAKLSPAAQRAIDRIRQRYEGR